MTQKMKTEQKKMICFHDLCDEIRRDQNYDEAEAGKYALKVLLGPVDMKEENEIFAREYNAKTKLAQKILDKMERFAQFVLVATPDDECENCPK